LQQVQGFQETTFFLRFGCNDRSGEWHLFFFLYGKGMRENEGLKGSIRVVIFIAIG